MGRPGAPWDTFGPSGNRSPLVPVFRAAECTPAVLSVTSVSYGGQILPAELRICAVSSADNLTDRNYALHELTKDTPTLVRTAPSDHRLWCGHADDAISPDGGDCLPLFWLPGCGPPEQVTSDLSRLYQVLEHPRTKRLESLEMTRLGG